MKKKLYEKKMEQQQCPICMLYLLPGMNLQDHLDTHPKDMIIKALLSAKTPAIEQQHANEMATVFLTTTPFNPQPPPPPAPHIYQQIAKRNPSNSPAVILGNKQPYRWATIDSPTSSTAAAATFLNHTSSCDKKDPPAFHHEQKNIMIVNTSSTQFSIQQTVPVKKQQSIELHPVIIDNANAAISIIPRYTSEKYSGPPPSYESSVTNTSAISSDKQQATTRVIDLTQTPTTSSASLAVAATTSKSGDLGPSQTKYLEYTQTENGDFMLSSQHDETPEIQEITTMNFDSINEGVADGQFELIDDHSNYSVSPNKKSTGVKVISNVKLTSTDNLSSTLKDIIQQYKNKQTDKSNVDEKIVSVHESESEGEDEEDEEEEEMKQEEEEVEVEDSTILIQCTETLNLNSKDNNSKEEDSIACTSVIRKTDDAGSSSSSSSTVVDSPQPSTSSACINNNNNNSNKSINVVFNSNRLKQNNKEIYKQPKKLVVKLKKPLEQLPTPPIKQESTQSKEEVINQKLKIETENREFTVTYIDNNEDFESISKITVTPEVIHHDSETNQSIMSMELEPETTTSQLQIIKRENVESDLPIIVKTEMNSCSELSMSRSSPGPSTSSSSSSSTSRGGNVNVESISASLNESSPINFIYQNDRVRFSPPLSPFVYMKTFTNNDGAINEDQPKQENDASWNNNSNSLVTQNSDQNSSCSRYTPSFDDNRSNYTDLDVNLKTSRSDVNIRAQSTDSLNIRTDEKMPARGEISEQESNGEMEQPWHHPVSFFYCY